MKRTLYVCLETQMGFKRLLHSHALLSEIIIASFRELRMKNSILVHKIIDQTLSFIFTTFYYYFKVNQRNLCYKNWVI